MIRLIAASLLCLAAGCQSGIVSEFTFTTETLQEELNEYVISPCEAEEFRQNLALDNPQWTDWEEYFLRLYSNSLDVFNSLRVSSLTERRTYYERLQVSCLRLLREPWNADGTRSLND
ncbi:MAG: hypothetical protein OXG90_11365 [Gammaproteobacteria bacterium]|nr:hypothetical protein [Gammaproteobacteria bacterium]